MSGSGSDYTVTPNLGLYKPKYSRAVGTWGDLWNSNADALDAAIHFASGGGPFLPLAGGTLNGTTDATHPFLFSHHSVSGTAPAGGANWYAFNVDNDNADATGAQGGGATGAYFGNAISAGAKGGRTGLSIYQGQFGATTALDGHYYVAFGAFNEAYHSAGGTTGAPQGALFAANIGATLKMGAGSWHTCVGMEIDVGIESGNTAQFKAGLSIVQFLNDAIQASIDDCAIGIANQSGGSAPGWKTGIEFGGFTGWWPFTNASTLIGTMAANNPGGPAMHAYMGVDLSAVTFVANAFNSTGFHVTGAGYIHTDAGLDFGSAVAPGGATDLTRHIQLYGGGYAGFSVTSNALNYVMQGGAGAHYFYVGGSEVAFIESAGIVALKGLAAWNGTPPASKPAMTGAKDGNTALASVIALLAAYGLGTDTTTA